MVAALATVQHDSFRFAVSALVPNVFRGKLCLATCSQQTGARLSAALERAWSHICSSHPKEFPTTHRCRHLPGRAGRYDSVRPSQGIYLWTCSLSGSLAALHSERAAAPASHITRRFPSPQPWSWPSRRRRRSLPPSAARRWAWAARATWPPSTSGRRRPPRRRRSPTPRSGRRSARRPRHRGCWTPTPPWTGGRRRGPPRPPGPRSALSLSLSRAQSRRGSLGRWRRGDESG